MGGRAKTNDQIFSPKTRTGSGVARNFKRAGHNSHIYFQRIFFGRSKLKLIRNKKTLGGSEGMLPRKIFENLHAIMAILVLFEYFQANSV